MGIRLRSQVFLRYVRELGYSVTTLAWRGRTRWSLVGCVRGNLLRLSQSCSCLRSPENLFQVLQVHFFFLAGDKNVVNIGTAKVETTQDTIDEALEGLGDIP